MIYKVDLSDAKNVKVISIDIQNFYKMDNKYNVFYVAA